MKNKKQNYMGASNLIEVIFPFPGKESLADADGLFDDCPLCQDLKKRIQSGEVEGGVEVWNDFLWERPS